MSGGPQIEIAGIRTLDDLGLVLTDATDAAPSPRTSYVDVPGRDGALDMTEALGRVAYSDREDSYTFAMPSAPDLMGALWLRRAAVINGLDGLEADYRLSWEPGYTRHGRWSVADMGGHADRYAITLKVRASPYRRRGEVVVYANAAGGIRVRLESGHRQVQPRVEVSRHSVLSVDGTSWDLQPGTWTLDDLWLRQGDNLVAVDTTPEYSVAALSDYAADALSAHEGEMMAALAAGGEPLQTPLPLSDIGSDALWEHEGRRLIDMTNPADADDETYNVYFAYDWEDL